MPVMPGIIMSTWVDEVRMCEHARVRTWGAERGKWEWKVTHQAKQVRLSSPSQGLEQAHGLLAIAGRVDSDAVRNLGEGIVAGDRITRRWNSVRATQRQAMQGHRGVTARTLY